MRGVLREALKEKRDPNCEREKRERRGGTGGDASGQDAAPSRRALGWGPAGASQRGCERRRGGQL